MTDHHAISEIVICMGISIISTIVACNAQSPVWVTCWAVIAGAWGIAAIVVDVKHF